MAVIEGGTTKVVGRKNEKLTMDASSSHDPDFPDEGHKIGWEKHPLIHILLQETLRYLMSQAKGSTLGE